MATIDVRVTTRAVHDEIDGWVAGRLRIRVTAPPVDGRANEAVIRLLARTFGLRVASITIAAGASSRLKRIEIDGMSREEVERRLGG